MPRLRFKDDDGREFPEWGIKLLGEISKFLDGRRRPIKESDRSKMKGQYPYYGASGIIDYVNDYIFDENIILLGEDGENILSRNLPLAFKVSGKCWVNNHAHVIKPNLSTNIDFLTQYLDSISYVKYNTGTAQPKLNQEVCRTIPLNLPSLPEQTKIANFLTAIDEKITQLTQKYDLLKQYKKGVMQQIFSQKLRFKDEDGREFPEWEAKRLGDVATFHNGRAYKQSEWEDNGLPVIRLQNLTGSSTNFYYSNIQLPENQYCNNGDLLYMWSATFGPVWWYGDKAIFHYHIWKIETESMCMSRNYLYYVLDDITAKMKNTSNGSTMAHITKEGILKRAVQLPCVKEQTKIANFLTAINDKITHTKTQLEAVKLYKKGLLQQMFV